MSTNTQHTPGPWENTYFYEAGYCPTCGKTHYAPAPKPKDFDFQKGDFSVCLPCALADYETALTAQARAYGLSVSFDSSRKIRSQANKAVKDTYEKYQAAFYKATGQARAAIAKATNQKEV